MYIIVISIFLASYVIYKRLYNNILLKILSLKDDIDMIGRTVKHNNICSENEFKICCKQIDNLSSDISLCRVTQEKLKLQYEDDIKHLFLRCDIEQIKESQDNLRKHLELIQRDLKDDITRINQFFRDISI